MVEVELDELLLLELELELELELDELSAEDVEVDSSMKPVLVVSEMPVVLSSTAPEDELPSARPDSLVLEEPSVVPLALALALADALILMPVVRTPVVSSSGAVVDPRALDELLPATASDDQ